MEYLLLVFNISKSNLITCKELERSLSNSSLIFTNDCKRNEKEKMIISLGKISPESSQICIYIHCPVGVQNSRFLEDLEEVGFLTPCIIKNIHKELNNGAGRIVRIVFNNLQPNLCALDEYIDFLEF